MPIKISQKLKPFSHLSGVASMIPGTSWYVQAFPCKLVFHNLLTTESIELDVEFLGPIRGFTVECDIYAQEVTIFGKEERGFFRFKIHLSNTSCILTAEKLPLSEIVVSLQGSKQPLAPKQSVPLFKLKENFPAASEQLFLGFNKALDVDLMKKRESLSEMLPLWFALGQESRFAAKSSSNEGSFQELFFAKRALAERKTLVLENHLKKLMLGAFSGILVPEVNDKLFQGLWPAASEKAVSAFPLLFQGYELIRSLFIQEKTGSIALLPCLLPHFVSGRLTGVKLSTGGSLHMEWSKSRLRSVIIFSPIDTTTALELPKEIKTFRLRRTRGERGKVVSVKEPLVLQAGHSVLCDRFEK